MKYWLEPLPVSDWSALCSAPVDEWLWLDMVDPGCHRGPLPAEQPTSVSHLWGWSADTWLRVRLDLDAQGGIAGAALLTTRTTGEGEPVHVVSTPVRTWAVGESRVSIPQAVESLVAGFGGTLYTAHTFRTSASPRRGLTMTALQFIELDASPLPAT